MNRSADNTALHCNTRVVEIVGPAGVGKTTLYESLYRFPDSIRLGNFPDVRKLSDAPFFVSNCLRLMPTLLRTYQPGSRRLTRREMAWMAILLGWPSVLRSQWDRSHKPVVLDQGPIYLMAELRLFGPEFLRCRSAEYFWQGLYDRWSETLNLVVWLDATDEVLLERIRARQQEHLIKDQPAAVAFKFLDSYRFEFNSILSALRGRMSDLKVLRFDTRCDRTETIIHSLLSEVGC